MIFPSRGTAKKNDRELKIMDEVVPGLVGKEAPENYQGKNLEK